jgi:formate dehydrogenase subunit gamma
MDASLNAELSALLNAHRDRPGALLPVLHAVQDALGHIPSAAVPIIARALNLSRAEVHGVIGFYRHFRSHAPGRHVVQICRAEACQAVGALELEAHARRALGCGFHATSADGSVTLEPVYCLGNCACGPSLRVDDEIVGRVDARRFDELLAELRSAP